MSCPSDIWNVPRLTCCASQSSRTRLPMGSSTERLPSWERIVYYSPSFEQPITGLHGAPGRTEASQNSPIELPNWHLGPQQGKARATTPPCRTASRRAASQDARYSHRKHSVVLGPTNTSGLGAQGTLLLGSRSCTAHSGADSGHVAKSFECCPYRCPCNTPSTYNARSPATLGASAAYPRPRTVQQPSTSNVPSPCSRIPPSSSQLRDGSAAQLPSWRPSSTSPSTSIP